jgi:hypothetical protein
MPQHSLTFVILYRQWAIKWKLVPPNSADDEAGSAFCSHLNTQRQLPFFPVKFSVENARPRCKERAEDTSIAGFHNGHVLIVTDLGHISS